ncbi:MAG: hypothetical protein GY869_05000, partial [Planctomycetes bacterium]|nr:hypothetical protein [Planctomycetota bacterium]
CTFTGNSAFLSGGGISNYNNSDLVERSSITNCTFIGNAANFGGGIDNFNCGPKITNCILWGNTALFGFINTNEIYNDSNIYIPPSDSTLIRYCDINGSFDGGVWDTALGNNGGGNIDADPLFVDPNGVDNILGTVDDNLHLKSYSPCIDMGDPSDEYSGQVDRDGQPRIRYDNVDIGAYEVYPIAGDFEPDEDIDMFDFAAFSSQPRSSPCSAPLWCGGADFDMNGEVNLNDIAIFGHHWLKGIQ